MALWSRAGRLPGADEELTLVLPAGTTVRRRKVTVPRHALLEELLALPADIEVGPSLRAWSVAARLALELVARGRLSPTVNPSGHDVWRLGPFDPDDARRQAALAVVLPLRPTAILSPGVARCASPARRPSSGPSATPWPTSCPAPQRRPAAVTRPSPPRSPTRWAMPSTGSAPPLPVLAEPRLCCVLSLLQTSTSSSDLKGSLSPPQRPLPLTLPLHCPALVPSRSSIPVQNRTSRPSWCSRVPTIPASWCRWRSCGMHQTPSCPTSPTPRTHCC